MDLFASVSRLPVVCALALLFGSSACVSEKGRAVDAGASGGPDAGEDGGWGDGARDSGHDSDAASVRDRDSGIGGREPADGGAHDSGSRAGDSGAPDDAGDLPSDAGDSGMLESDAGDGGDPGCEQGFVLVGIDCVRDRCEDSATEDAVCADHGTCSNGTEVTPTCVCDEGYVLEGLECMRNGCIDTVAEPAVCDVNATCAYQGAGAVTCECNEGYEGDGFSCQRNACIQLPGEDPPCAANEVCMPTSPGMKACTCEVGFDDCDDSATNGCEVELDVDADHCGVCDRACAVDLACDVGSCEQRVSDMALSTVATIMATPVGDVLGSGADAGAGGTSPMLNGHAVSTVPVKLSLAAATQVSANADHACLVRQDGTGAACWGSNPYLQLGSSSTGSTYADLALVGVKAIAAGASHTCLVAADGKVYCWGMRSDGQLGDGYASMSTTTRSFAATVPAPSTPVLNVTGAVDVKAGGTMTCALTESGLVYCWGSASGVYSPEVVRDASGVPLEATEICVGQAHACALRDPGRIVCWGDDSDGQLGSNVNPGGRSRYVFVPLLEVQSIACGGKHTCALLADGTAQCWGQNVQGQLATGDTTSSTLPLPVLLPPGAEVRRLHAGSGAAGTCVELTTGAVYCAGFNYFGALGIGTQGDQWVATLTEITEWP